MEKGDEAQVMAKRKRGEGNIKGEKGYKKGIIILFTNHAMPGTPASLI